MPEASVPIVDAPGRRKPVAQQVPHSVASRLPAPFLAPLRLVGTIERDLDAAELLGHLFQRLKQPAVIGEMLAGILLGPSLLGMTFPAARDFLFPASSLGGLQLFA